MKKRLGLAILSSTMVGLCSYYYWWSVSSSGGGIVTSDKADIAASGVVDSTAAIVTSYKGLPSAPPKQTHLSAGQSTVGVLRGIEERLDALEEGDSTAVEQLTKELLNDATLTRTEKLQLLLRVLKAHLDQPTFGTHVATYMLLNLAPKELLPELQTLYRETTDPRLKQELYGQVAALSTTGLKFEISSTFKALPPDQQVQTTAFFRESALNDGGTTAFASLRIHGNMASSAQAADTLQLLTQKWKAAKVAGSLGPDNPLSPLPLVQQLFADMRQHPEEDNRYLGILDSIISESNETERGEIRDGIRAALEDFTPSLATKTKLHTFLESNPPPPSPTPDYIRWLEALSAVQAGAGDDRAAPQELLSRIRSERDPLNVGSVAAYADPALLAELSKDDARKINDILAHQLNDVKASSEEHSFYSLAMERLASALTGAR